METDTEHQENYPQLSQLLNDLHLADKTGCKRADDNTCQQVANNGRQAKSPGKDSTKKCHDQRQGNIDQQRHFMHVLLSFPVAS